MAGPNGSSTPLLSEPTVWSARLLAHLDKMFVYVAALTNRDYEGEAQRGGTVKIFRVNNVAVTDYDGGWSDADWQNLGDTEVELQISQEKKFIFKLSDVRQQFSIIQMIDQGAQRAAQAIGDVIDQYVASKYTQVAPANTLGTDAAPVVVGFGAGQTRPTIALALLRERLVTARAASMAPRVVVPEWFGTMLEIELGANMARVATQEGAVNQPGYMGAVGGFSVFVSPNVPNVAGAQYKALAGEPNITFASAIDKVETTRLQNDFATGVKGLYVYDAKLLEPASMALATFNRGAYTA